jgi:maleate isomerase
VLALRLLKIEQIALVHPPWFDGELNALGASYFRSQGFHIVTSASAELSRDPRQIEPAAVFEWTSRHVPAAAEAVFIGGNGFRAARAIEALEGALGRPVLESNQVLLWNLLAHTHASITIRGYGSCLLSNRTTIRSRRALARKSAALAVVIVEPAYECARVGATPR